MAFGSDAYKRIEESLTSTNVLSDDYKRHILAWALKIQSDAYAAGKESVEVPVIDADQKIVSKEQWDKLVRDHNDMMNAAQTIFGRCSCGRVKEQGIICPTVQEGGDCEEGR